jgi:hypothetical protein
MSSKFVLRPELPKRRRDQPRGQPPVTRGVKRRFRAPERETQTHHPPHEHERTHAPPLEQTADVSTPLQAACERVVARTIEFLRVAQRHTTTMNALAARGFTRVAYIDTWRLLLPVLEGPEASPIPPCATADDAAPATWEEEGEPQEDAAPDRPDARDLDETPSVDDVM